jgi:hypothetical protein
MAIALQFSTAPYPGLRPFRYEESDIFFGRERQVDHILARLGRNRFLAITGPSGCGKSSLVAAAIIPALQAGFMADVGSRWRTCAFRPGARPLQQLAEGLAPGDILGADRTSAGNRKYIEVALRRGPLSLIELVRGAEALKGTTLLILVDQFEEIFRYHERISVDEADAFVALLLASVAQAEIPIYVILTMRSDYLGQCAKFHGLAEAVSNSQYLTPRLTREELELAIAGPARVFGGQVAPRLLNRLLNDFGTAQDQLPLLQHALARLWDRCSRSAEAPVLAVSDYEAIGGLADALSRHGDEILSELTPEQQRIAEVMFRRLSGTDDERQDVRCPARVDEVAEVAGVDPAEVIAVAEAFCGSNRSFLAVPAGPLHEDTMLDISHESLIRQWRKMAGWVAEESESAEMYRRTNDWALRWERGEAELWRGHDIASAVAWRERENPNAEWAERYGGPEQFQRVVKFLAESEKARNAADAAEEASRQLRYRRARRVAWGLGSALASVSVAILVYLVAYSWNYNRYYKDYVKIRGVPDGIGPLSPADLGHRTTAYKITRRGRLGPVVTMQLVNGAGQPRDRAGTLDAMFSPKEQIRNRVTRWEYVYDAREQTYADCKRTSAACQSVAYEMLFDRNGHRIESTIYSPVESQDSRYAYTTGQEGSLAPEKGSCAAFSRVSYTPEGYEARIDYLDQGGNPTPGKDAAFSKLLEHDQAGHLIRGQSLWRDGTPMNDADGSAESRVSYDSAGNAVSSEYFDAAGKPANGKIGYHRLACEPDQLGNCKVGRMWRADGRPLAPGNVGNVKAGLCRSTAMHHDDRGNLVEFACLMPNGQPARSAKTAYDEHDWPVEDIYLDRAGHPALGPLGGLRTALKHDQSGSIVELAFFGAESQPAISFPGYHKKLSTFADAREVRTEYRDGVGALVAIEGGIAGIEREFDNHGNETKITYLGTDGKPAPNRETGYAVETTVLDTCGREAESKYLDENAKPVRSKSGYASIRKIYNEQNQVAEEYYFDEIGQPIRSVDGSAHVSRRYDRNRNTVFERYFDEQGRAVSVNGGHAGRYAKYDDHNALIEEAFVGTRGEPVLNEHRWSKQIRRYDEHNGLVEEAFFGVQGEPVANDAGYARAVYVNDVHSWHVETTYFDPGGKPVLGRQLYAKKVNRYDADGNVVDESYFGIDGTPALSGAGYARTAKEYDEFGRTIGWAYFGVLDEPVIGKTESYHRVSLKLDERGNQVGVSVFGTDQRPMVSSMGHANRVTRYDDWNRAVDEAYFGVNGEPIADDDGYARITILRELHGKGLEVAYFGTDDKPVKNKQGYAKIKRRFNDYGDLIEEAVFGPDGEPALNEQLYHRLEQANDRLGRVTETAYFGLDNRPTDINQYGALRATFSYVWGEKPVQRILFFADGVRETEQLRNDEPTDSIVTDITGAPADGPKGYAQCHVSDRRQCFDHSGTPLVEAVEIFHVKPDGAAERAQIRKGDLVVSYDGMAMSSLVALDRAVADRASTPGQVSVVVIREGRSISFQVPAGRMGIRTRAKFVPAALLQSNPEPQHPDLGEGH